MHECRVQMCKKHEFNGMHVKEVERKGQVPLNSIKVINSSLRANSCSVEFPDWLLRHDIVCDRYMVS